LAMLAALAAPNQSVERSTPIVIAIADALRA
jgi:hypothetical protein